MSIGFKKSLFGFNCDDVISYIKRLHNDFKGKENAFQEQIDNLEAKINALGQNQLKLEAEKAELNAKLSEYDEKTAEMERLSENIGKLYLVAQTNSKNIMDNAVENSKATEAQILSNISTIEEAHYALEEIRQNINKTAESFTNELNTLMSSLEATKEKLQEDAVKNTEASNEFEELLEAVSK